MRFEKELLENEEIRPAYQLVSQETYAKFVRCFDSNRFPSQRFGQAFVNQYLRPTPEQVKAGRSSMGDAELFYVTDRKRAIEIIAERYLQP